MWVVSRCKGIPRLVFILLGKNYIPAAKSPVAGQEPCVPGTSSPQHVMWRWDTED